MEWFKFVIAIIFAAEAGFAVALMGGYQPKPSSKGTHLITFFLVIFLAIGTLLWL